MIHRSRMTRKVNDGFTLIEILIVIVIMSVISGVALVTISSNQKKQCETLANQLTRLITLAEQEAMLRPATLALGFNNHHFQFLHYIPSTSDENPWQTMASKSLGLHRIPDHIQIMLYVNNQHTPLDNKPRILISESGDITPFIITIAKIGDKPSYIVRGEASGKVQTEVFHDKE